MQGTVINLNLKKECFKITYLEIGVTETSIKRIIN